MVTFSPRFESNQGSAEDFVTSMTKPGGKAAMAFQVQLGKEGDGVRQIMILLPFRVHGEVFVLQEFGDAGKGARMED